MKTRWAEIQRELIAIDAEKEPHMLAIATAKSAIAALESKKTPLRAEMATLNQQLAIEKQTLAIEREKRRQARETLYAAGREDREKRRQERERRQVEADARREEKAAQRKQAALDEDALARKTILRTLTYHDPATQSACIGNCFGARISNKNADAILRKYDGLLWAVVNGQVWTIETAQKRGWV